MSVGVSTVRASHFVLAARNTTLSTAPANTIFIVMFFAQLYFMYLVFKVECGLQVGVFCLLQQPDIHYVYHMVSI